MEKQIPALFKPRAREAEVTITTRGHKLAFVRLVDFDKIGVQEVKLLNSGVTRDTVRVKVSMA
jgi:hypothetical protein